MSESFARSSLPWIMMVVVVEILVITFVKLYFIDVQLIQTGAISQINRNVILNKAIVDYSGLLAALIVIGGVAFRTWKKSIPLLIQEIVQIFTVNGKETYSKGTGREEALKKASFRTLVSVAIKDILFLGRMGECEDFQQWFSHFLTMWGFIGLAVTTTLDAIVNNAAVPLPITDPVRLLGNFSGIVFMAGLTLSIARRAFHPDIRSASGIQSWIFLISLYGTAATGFAVQVFADTSNLTATWVSYPIHLAFISFLLITAPWTRFVHALWRPSWIVYSRLNSQSIR